jgi:DegV family protein with EDD domain
MSRIAVVTDSAANIPAELLQEYGIHVVPLEIRFGRKLFLDGIDITANEFYSMLREVKDKPPTTSQPPVGKFYELYERLIGKFDAIVSVHVSGKLSGTLSSAEQAAQMLVDVPIRLVDSLSASIGEGAAALAAARAAAAGKDLADVVDAAEQVARKVRIFCTVDTLKYLHMGGRIGSARALLGTALQIKPILQIYNGVVEAAGSARTRARALGRMMDAAVESVGGEGSRVRAAAISAQDPECAQDLRERLQARLDCVELHTIDLTPTVGTHLGPGAVGVMVQPAD